MQDLTKTHSQQFMDKDGRKHVVIKPLRIERKVHSDGRVDVKIVVPRLSLKPKTNPA